ncbi:hypothetical protein NVV93_11635 [Pseudomonas sp. LS44]|uniref:hypothetical protein n=1 Tax=Pseudomonas sp. LS44 TaxID=1357074 RepID=UPI00215A284B|nr:hypothetical protein [Pseudomonas sp. LS44]UVE16272.1 hypothetical protein NVV93_11635 [Pseudomonas sp. LS44]
MSAKRTLGLLLMVLALGACDDGVPPVPKVPPSAPVPKPPTTAPQEAGKSELVIKQAPASVEETPVPKASLDPGLANKPAEKPAESKVAKPDLEVKEAPKSAQEKPLPQATLDLRLPKELVDSLEHEVPVPEEPKPLLPPMFAPKEPSEGPFQLNGKLITNDREDDYLRSVEGAELQFEFKQ